MIFEVKNFAQYNLEQIDYSNCLRPNFTAIIMKELVEKQKSINLIGKRGIGKTHLLNDICKCSIPNTFFLFIDLKSFKNDYKGFIDEIRRQLNLSPAIPKTLPAMFTSTHLNNRVVIVLLDNFDAILNTNQKDTYFDIEFLNQLNSLKNRNQIRLLCVTRTEQSSMMFYYGDNVKSTSWLTLEIEEIPDLDEIQIKQELERKMEIFHWKWLVENPIEMKLLLTSIRESPTQVSWMEFIIKKFRDEFLNDYSRGFKNQLHKWKKEFENHKKSNLDKIILDLREWLRKKKILLGIKNTEISFFSAFVNFLNRKKG